MSYISIQAKLFKEARQRNYKLARGKEEARIDRTYTTFGGNGILTQEQWEKGMQLSKKMKDYSAW